MYYTYVLHSQKDLNFYVGFTKNLKLRFEQHNKGLVESTEARRPLKLIYYEACEHESDALKREILKNIPRKNVHQEKTQILL